MAGRSLSLSGLGDAIQDVIAPQTPAAAAATEPVLRGLGTYGGSFNDGVYRPGRPGDASFRLIQDGSGGYLAGGPLDSIQPIMIGEGDEIIIGVTAGGVDAQYIRLPNRIGLTDEGFRPGQPDYHIYDLQFNLGPGESLMPLVFANPTPGPSDRPSTLAGTLNTAAPLVLGEPGLWEFLVGVGQGIFPYSPPAQYGFPAAVFSHRVPMDGVVGGYANVNVARPGHALDGAAVIFETRQGNDRILHVYGMGGGELQNTNGMIGQYTAQPMNSTVWQNYADEIMRADRARTR